MILSKYCEFVLLNPNKPCLFNFLTNDWIEFDKDLYHILLNFKHDIEYIGKIHPELYQLLKTKEFIVLNDNVDLDKCVAKMRKSYTDFTNTTITINPTMDCNVKCWYCYEDHIKRSRMSSIILTQTIQYVNKILTSQQIENLHISFFGGEPLMYYYECIRPILQSVAETCNIVKTKLSIGITTNGILITDNIIQDLSSFSNLIHLQLPFDGNRELHNNVKKINSNFSCYDQSINNAIKALKAGINVTIRCNYTSKNILTFYDLIHEFKGHSENKHLRFSFQRVWQERETPELLKKKRYLQTLLDSSEDFNLDINTFSNHSIRKCYADFKNNIVINYNGDVFRCTARSFTPENTIGKLSDNGGLKMYPPKFTKADFPFPENCLTCRILPICPICIQGRLENKASGCPISADKKMIQENIFNVFKETLKQSKM